MYPATDIDPFRAPPPGQGKARSAVNGAPLGKDRNAAMAGWGRSLRADQGALIRCVTPLGKGMALPGEASLAAKRSLAR
mgnify:CR=1 FL=1